MTFFKFGSEIAIYLITLNNKLKNKRYGNELFNSCWSDYVI